MTASAMTDIFNIPIPKLRQWSRRQMPDHRQLNEPVEAINRMMTGIAPPHQSFVQSSSRGAGVSVSSMTVLVALDPGLTDDYLICRESIIGTEYILGDIYFPIFVAKPWLLRVTPHNSLGPDDASGPTRGDMRYVYDPVNTTKRTAYDINDPPDTPEDMRNKRSEMISPQYLPDRQVDDLFIPGDEIQTATLKPPMMIAMTIEGGEEVDVPVSLIDVTGGRAWTVFFEQL